MPVIAILSNPLPAKIRPIEKSRVSNNYAKWITASGGRVIAIHPWQTDEEIFDILEEVNGLLIQGGIEDIDNENEFVFKIFKIFDKVIEMNDEGKVFPVLGSCMGLELIMTYFSKAISDGFRMYNYFFTKIDVGPMLSTLKFEVDDMTKTLAFKFFSSQDLEDISTKAISTKFHHNGILPETYNKFPGLIKNLLVTTTSIDRQGVRYITSIEGKKYPFIGLHFHAEKTVYHVLDEPVAGSHEAITSSRNIGNAFIDLAMKNPNDWTLDQIKNKFHYVDQEILKATLNPIGLIYTFENPKIKSQERLTLEDVN